MRVLLITACVALLATSAFADTRDPAQSPYRVAQGASSCSGWKAICETRGPGCDAKFSACLKSGCWTEGVKFGGGTQCGLAKK